MKTKMTGSEFNRQLRNLCQEAMQDGEMNVFEILGGLMAAQFIVVRNAVMAAQQAQAKEFASQIQPATTLPPSSKN